MFKIASSPIHFSLILVIIYVQLLFPETKNGVQFVKIQINLSLHVKKKCLFNKGNAYTGMKEYLASNIYGINIYTCQENILYIIANENFPQNLWSHNLLY